MFNLGDQSSNKCKYFEPSELARRARETFKLDKVDWLLSNSYYVKGVAEGKAKPCDECGQTLYEKMERFLTRRLREIARNIKEGFDKIHRVYLEKAPPAIKYTVFLSDLFSSHNIKGQGMMHPEGVSSSLGRQQKGRTPALRVHLIF